MRRSRDRGVEGKDEEESRDRGVEGKDAIGSRDADLSNVGVVAT